MPDFTNIYNTELTPEQEAQFQAAYPAAKDLYDYDLRGAFKQNGFQKLGPGHGADTFKKPNHPTFSNESQYHGKNGLEGGSWVQLPDKSYTFTPGKTNWDNFSPSELQNYFKKVEPGNKLNSQPYKLMPVPYDPFDPKVNAANVEAQRSNGGRADLNNPISPGPAPSYGIRPPIMDPNLPEFEQFQPNSLG
jgi:hypothetical protein